MSEKLEVQIETVEIATTTDCAMVTLCMTGPADYKSVADAVEEFVRSVNWHVNYYHDRREDARRAAEAKESS